jgi:hypothetical protein
MWPFILMPGEAKHFRNGAGHTIQRIPTVQPKRESIHIHTKSIESAQRDIKYTK